MTTDLTMFPELDADAVLKGRVAKADGMSAAESHAPREWLSAARQAGRQVALLRQEFTTDPIWRVLELQHVQPPHEPRAMGPVMDSLMKAGVCFKTTRVSPSARPECHRRPLTVYRSLIYKGGS